MMKESWSQFAWQCFQLKESAIRRVVGRQVGRPGLVDSIPPNTDIIINNAPAVQTGDQTRYYTQLVLTLARRNVNIKNCAGLLHFSLFE